MSSLQQLADRLRADVVDRYGLTEVGDPYEVLTLAATGEQVGEVRVWTGPLVPKLVDSRLVVPAQGIDSVMLHAFAGSGTSSPHLGSDVAGFGGRLSFNIDLTPRVDLAVDPGYLDEVYAPLTEPRAAVLALGSAEPIDLSLRLLAFSSPWIVGVTVDESDLPGVERAYAAYLDRFHALVAAEPPVAVEPDLAARDRRQRRAQFDPASDEVWDFLAEMLGRTSVDTILDLVREPGPPAR